MARARKPKAPIVRVLRNGEPAVGDPAKGILLTPSAPDLIGFVSLRPEPRVGEQGTLEACASVVKYLNAHGESWKPPINPATAADDKNPHRERGVDCISESLMPPAHGAQATVLQFQVTRAARDTAFWTYLGENKGVMAYRTLREIAADLWDAITAKANAISPLDRPSITLVLDASDLYAHHSDGAATAFAASYGTAAATLGFHSIWVSSGVTTYVQRLG